MTTHTFQELMFRMDWFSYILKMTSYLCLSLSAQFWRGEWPVGGTQPPGPPGQPRLWSGHAAQLPSQPEAGILPLPLRLWLWPFTQGSVQKLLHSQWPVSSPPRHPLYTCAYRLLTACKPVHCILLNIQFMGSVLHETVNFLSLWMRIFFQKK